jgi:hypothetical protein
MRTGLAKIIEQVRISSYFESPEADIHKAENACCINYANTGSPNEFIDCQKGKVNMAVLPITDEKTRWNSTLELLERAYYLWEFTSQWLQSLKYAEYRPLFTTQDDWTIGTYVMEGLRPF